MPTFLKTDNDLLIAEAYLNLGQLADAIAMLNAGTRVTRGQLPTISNSAMAAEIQYAIQYERAIELFNTAPMSLWFDRRRFGPRLDYLALDALGGLQIGSPAQLPVPADELKVQGEEPYNFGGALDPEGVLRIY